MAHPPILRNVLEDMVDAILEEGAWSGPAAELENMLVVGYSLV